MRTMIHSAAQPPGVILRHARRTKDSPKTTVAPLVRTVQRAPDVRPWPCQHQPPPTRNRIVHRCTDMLVLVVVHLPTYSTTADLGEKEAIVPIAFCFIPGMKESIVEGLRTPIEQCAKELDW